MRRIFYTLSFILCLSFLLSPLNGFSKNSKGLRLYKGKIHHVFFHPLLPDTKKAFKPGKGLVFAYNYFVTPKEYINILKALYKRNFVLINADSIYTKKSVNNKIIIQRKAIYLPKGKKPLILSVDDINYYKVQKERGSIARLSIDRQNRICGVEMSKRGRCRLDNNLFSILETFIAKHPDFSFKGARGLAGLTGYEGVFGYRTDKLDSPLYKTRKRAALKVANKLKSLGWLFASHSYLHIHSHYKSLARLRYDCRKWKKEVEPVLGKTELYIFPYGESCLRNKSKRKLLLSYGFKAFFGVSFRYYLQYQGDLLYGYRFPADGIAISLAKKRNWPYFSYAEVQDKNRPLKKDLFKRKKRRGRRIARKKSKKRFIKKALN